MAWVKLDDHFATHPKVLALAPAAVVLHLRALCYSAQHLTDGHIPFAVCIALRGDLGDDLPRVLVSADVWEERPDGFQIHDYLEYNPSRELTLRERSQAAKRMRRLRRSSPEHREKFNDPVPVPVTTTPKTRTTRSGEHKAEHHATWLTPFGHAWQERCGDRVPWKQLATFLAPVCEKYGHVHTLAAFKRYLADTDPQFASAARFTATTTKWGLGTSAKHPQDGLPDAYLTLEEQEARRARARATEPQQAVG